MAILARIGRAVAKALVPRMVRVGWSFRGTFGRLRQLGHRVSRPFVRKQYVEQKVLDRTRSYLPSLSPDQRPDPAFLPGWHMGEAPNYRLWGRGTFRHRITGEYVQRDISMYSDFLRTPNEYTEEFRQTFAYPHRDTEWELIGMEWLSMVRNEDSAFAGTF